MRQIKAILLLFVLGIIIFPWHLVCTSHPLGEEHHHDGPSPCELRRIALEKPGEHLLPPMECEHHVLKIQKYQPPQVEKIVPTLETLAILTILFELPNVFSTYEQPFLLPPDPQCRSATLVSDNPLRGPPFV